MRQDRVPRATRGNPTRPAAKPFIEDLFVAPDGKLWVEVVRTAGNRWEVFDTEGKLLGSVPAPPRREYVVPAFGPDYLLTIRRDSLDLDHVDGLAPRTGELRARPEGTSDRSAPDPLLAAGGEHP